MTFYNSMGLYKVIDVQPLGYESTKKEIFLMGN
jgi:hypothetical protein